MKKIFIPLITISVCLLSSCSPVKYACFDTEGIDNSILKESTENSISFSELKKSISFVDKNSREYNNAVKKNTLVNILVQNKYCFEKEISSENTVMAVVERQLHIPVTDFRNTEANAETDDIIKEKYKTDIPENIRLSEKGLSFKGLYPDNPEYSLYKEIRLSVILPDKISDKQKNLVKTWISEIDIGNTLTDSNTGSPCRTGGTTINEEADNKVTGENQSKGGTGDSVRAAASEADIIWFGAVGDIMPARGVQDILISDKKGMEKIFSDTLPLLQGFDLLAGNLEGPVTYSKAAIKKAYNFKFRHRVLGKLEKAGFDYLSAVNNHCYDFDEQGFLDTLKNLNLYKIKTSGAGKNLSEALEPALFRIKGTDFRILSLADYPAEKDKFEGKKETQASEKKPGILWPSEAVFKAVKKMSEKEGVSVVMVHGGFEWQNQPAESQKKLYRKLADTGADIVIGSHPHVLQPVETWNSSLIIYSLGNFVFPGMDETEYGEESMILSIGFYEGKALYINYIPVSINGKYLSLDKSGRILGRFSALNSDFSSLEKINREKPD